MHAVERDASSWLILSGCYCMNHQQSALLFTGLIYSITFGGLAWILTIEEFPITFTACGSLQYASDCSSKPAKRSKSLCQKHLKTCSRVWGARMKCACIALKPCIHRSAALLSRWGDSAGRKTLVSPGIPSLRHLPFFVLEKLSSSIIE
jgi:hypothetical protein